MRQQNFNTLWKFSAVPCLLICSFAAIFFVRCSSESDARERSPGKMIPVVEAVETRHGSLPLTQRLSGVVKAKNQVEIYPEVSAPIVEVYVNNGAAVKQRQPLIRLRDKEFQERLKQARAGYQIAAAQLRQSEAQFDEIQAALTRAESLAAQNLASDTELQTARTRAISAEADVELAKARLAQAQATVDEREETLSQTVIRAPVSGTVGNRNAEVGMLVTGNSRLFTLGQLDSVRVEVVLTDRMLTYIEEDQRAEIHAPNSLSAPLSAPLTRISPFLHPVTHSTEGEIDLANPDRRLKSGMFVTTDIFYGESEQATLVPLSALYENPITGVTGIYVTKTALQENPSDMGDLQNGELPPLTDAVSFDFVPVEIIAKGRMEAAVTGVEAGSWVITLGQNLLGGKPGEARVRPVNWVWVEQLQNLQREDLMERVIEQKKSLSQDSLSLKPNQN